MQVIIDGYNYILRGAQKSTSELDVLRQALIQKLAGHVSSKNIRVTVVFDGQAQTSSPHASDHGKVKVVFSRPPENADAVIKRMIQSHKQPRNILVVTSDQPLARFVRSCGCQLMSTEAWRNRMEQGGEEAWEEKYGPMNTTNMQEWLKLFKGYQAEPE